MLLDTSGARGRLLRRGEVQQVASLSARGERMEGFGQVCVIIQALLEFQRHCEFCHGLFLHPGAGFFHGNGRFDICLYGGFLFVDVGNRGKADLPADCTLRVC